MLRVLDKVCHRSAQKLYFHPGNSINCGYFDIHEHLSSVEHEKSFISSGPDHGLKSQAKTGAANRSNQ